MTGKMATGVYLALFLCGGSVNCLLRGYRADRVNLAAPKETIKPNRSEDEKLEALRSDYQQRVDRLQQSIEASRATLATLEKEWQEFTTLVDDRGKVQVPAAFLPHFNVQVFIDRPVLERSVIDFLGISQTEREQIEAQLVSAQSRVLAEEAKRQKAICNGDSLVVKVTRFPEAGGRILSALQQDTCRVLGRQRGEAFWVLAQKGHYIGNVFSWFGSKDYRITFRNKGGRSGRMRYRWSLESFDSKADRWRLAQGGTASRQSQSINRFLSYAPDFFKEPRE